MNKAIFTISFILMFSLLFSQQVLDFENVPPGFTGNVIDDITINVTSATNTGSVFDSSNPTGGDIDLGTPNEDFGGPGIGNGGKIYEAYQNDLALGNVYIIAEDVTDNNNDGLIDNPDDEAGGGEIEFIFPSVTEVLYLWILDNENEASNVKGYDDQGSLVYEQEIFDTGDNGIVLVGVFNDEIKRLVVDLSGSGAVASIDYNVAILPVTLKYFRGFNKSGLHILEWESEEEQAFDYYDIEESRDGRSWTNIGYVKGRGPSKYMRRFIPFNGITYYRLKMVDLNGSVEYSPIISIAAHQTFINKVMNMSGLQFYNYLMQPVHKNTNGVLVFFYEGKAYKITNISE
jgi:hypothetical protein